jgi:serine/threonine protein kinase
MRSYDAPIEEERSAHMPRRGKRSTSTSNESLELDISVDAGESEETSPARAGQSPSGTEQIRRPPSARMQRRDSDVMPDPNIGKVLGSYRLVSLLGEGGMGRVYCAEHTMLGRKVALKLLRPEYAAKRDAVQRFFQEARAVNAIGHDNIVDITDYVELPSGETFFIMQLLQGSNLGTLLRQRDDPLPLHDSMNIALQVCDALCAAHAKRIVHRDLKPDNIFVVEDANKGLFVKLLDFGVAKLLGEAAAELSWETAAGSVLGTPAYMSPEQATGLTVDHRTDIYSLGAILYEMFTGQPVFRAKSFGEFVLKHMNDQPVPPSEITDTPIPPALEQIILRCLEKDPDDRYEDVAELREDLVRATATVERAIRRRFSGSSRVNSTRRRQRIRALVTSLAVGLVAIAAFWFAAGLGVDGEEESSEATGGTERSPDTRGRTIAATRDDSKRGSGRSAHTRQAKGNDAGRTARLRLLSQPPGATVYKKNETLSYGTTPLALTLRNPGSQIDLVFRCPGFKPVTERVNITDNAVISVTLQPTSTDPALDDSDDLDLDDMPLIESPNRRHGRSRRHRSQPDGQRQQIQPEEMIDPFGKR